MADSPELYYRYDDILTTSGPRINFWSYPVTKHTAHGVWLDLGFNTKRFVRTGTRKTFACHTKELAKLSYIARKKRQLKIYKAKVKQVEILLEQIVEYDEQAFQLS